MVAHAFEYRDDGAVIVTFDADTTAFASSTAAELCMEDRGFSVGRRQAHEPRGILFGRYDIRKWRDLNSIERKALHGEMTGDGRHGPIRCELFADAPREAREAIVATAARCEIGAATPERRGIAMPIAVIFLLLVAFWATVAREVVVLSGPPIAKSMLRVDAHASARMEARR